ncbi:hypothetical protein Tco_0452296 [Tanacetum coccineum]
MEERLVGNLCTVWIGRHRIHANAARFHRPKGSTSSHQPAMKGKIRDSSIGNTKDNGHRDDVKEVGVLENLKVALGNEGFTDIDLRYMGGLWVMIAFDFGGGKARSLLVSYKYVRLVHTANQVVSEFITDERVTMVEIEVWREAPVDNSNAMINMMNKLKYLKKKIRVWNGMRQSLKTQKHVLKQELTDLEMIIDKGDASSDTLHKRTEVVKSIQEVDKLCAMEASQKAKIKWAIEGDENSKYCHGILNKKRNQLSIRGVLMEDWVENPNMVKNEFLNHFKNRF